MNTRSTQALQVFIKLPALVALLALPLALHAGSTAPQDSVIKNPAVTLVPQTDDGTNFYIPRLQTVFGTDLIYYEFIDATNVRRGIRARDLDGNLVYEIVSPGYTSHDIRDFDVAPDGTIYAIERRGTDYFVYVYQLSGGPPGTYAETDAWGPGGTGDANSWSATIDNYGSIRVSPVSGKVYVKESALISHVDTDGELQVFDSSGTLLSPIQINGILAPTLEGDIYDYFLVPGHDGTGELWVRGNVGNPSSFGSRSQWFKVFDELGNFNRLFDMSGNGYAAVYDDFVYTSANTMIPITADNLDEYTGRFFGNVFSLELTLGKDSLGRFVYPGNLSSSTTIKIYESPVFRTFDPRDQNSIPNPVVSKIEQRSGFTILDIDYRVEDSDNATVTTAAVALPDGTLSVLNALPLTTFADGTGSNLGAGIPTNTRTTLSWNAGTDWNVDFGDISVLVLARDDRTYYFDIHLVDIPADGARPAVTISRNPLEEYDFTMQWLWLIGTNDPAISFTGGIITGTPAAGATYDGQQLTDGSGISTALGRDFLLERDGLRVATPAEVLRAREGATEGFIVQLDPPNEINTVGRPYSLPLDINEYGVESYNSAGNNQGYYFSGANLNLWHVVPIAP